MITEKVYRQLYDDFKIHCKFYKIFGKPEQFEKAFKTMKSMLMMVEKSKDGLLGEQIRKRLKAKNLYHNIATVREINFYLITEYIVSLGYDYKLRIQEGFEKTSRIFNKKPHQKDMRIDGEY